MSEIVRKARQAEERAWAKLETTRESFREYDRWRNNWMAGRGGQVRSPNDMFEAAEDCSSAYAEWAAAGRQLIEAERIAAWNASFGAEEARMANEMAGAAAYSAYVQHLAESDPCAGALAA